MTTRRQFIAGAAARALQERDAADWSLLLRRWADAHLLDADKPLLDEAVPIFERVMIEAAMAHTHGLKQDAAMVLGWGRNTLARKMKELGMDE